MSVDYLAISRKYLRRAAEPEAAAPEAAEPRSRSELLRLAGDAVEPITLHCQTCETCRPEAFVGDVVQFPLCRWGRELRRDYREARRQALDACRAAEADGKAGARGR